MRDLVFGICVFMIAAQAGAQCCGDCNADGRVGISELIVSVNAALSDCAGPPRFVVNGDGTVSDRQTGLQWELKRNLDSVANLADPHDADNRYSWSGNAPDLVTPKGTAFTMFLAQLNGTDGGPNMCVSSDGTTLSGGFAGYCDWRLPSSVELAGIFDPTQGFCGGASGACIDPAFGPTPVAPPESGAVFTWSATSTSADTAAAWTLVFDRTAIEPGRPFDLFKPFSGAVRAVRNGS